MRVQFSITWVLFLILFAREALAIGCGYSPPSVTLLQQSFAEDAEGSVPAPWEPHTGHWVVDENTLTLTTKDEAGRPLSIARWKRMP